MSKKVNGNVGKKRSAKVAKRAGRVYKAPQPKLSEFAVMLKKANFQAKKTGGTPMECIDFDNVKLVNDAKQHIANIYTYFGTLVFARGLIKEKVIQPIGLKVDLIDAAKKILSVNNRLKTIPLLDDPQVYAYELFTIGELIQDLGLSISEDITKLDPYNNVIEAVINECGKNLPPKEDGTDRNVNEMYYEVIRYISDDFMYQNGLIKPHTEQKSEEVVE